MRPYLAIIKDSFRAAWASKVLYVLLGLITVLLLVLAPLHYRQSLDWKLIPEEYLQQTSSITSRLIDRKDDADHPLMGKIWEELPEGLRKELSTRDQSTGKQNNPTKQNLETFSELIGELNNIIAKVDFFRR